MHWDLDHQTIGGTWYRHRRCGRVVPYWGDGYDSRTKQPVPYCVVCDDQVPWEDRPLPPIGAKPDLLLYLVRFWPHRGPRFIKVGYTGLESRRLQGHLRLPYTAVLQVVQGPHQRVRDAETAIKTEFAGHRVYAHDYGYAFRSRETFRLGIADRIGDLQTWTGRRGVHDRTRDYGLPLER